MSWQTSAIFRLSWGRFEAKKTYRIGRRKTNPKNGGIAQLVRAAES